MSRTFIITGAGRGIGRAISKSVAEHFCGRDFQINMVLISRTDEAALKSLCSELPTGVSALPLMGDISDKNFRERVVSEARNRFGGVDVLINNAGISQIDLLQDMTSEEISRMIDVNLTAPIALSALVIPDLLKSVNSPRIINISSVWGNVGASCEAVYSATKGGLNSFTKALGKELAPSRIPVNAIACGLIDTSMNAHLSEEEMQELYEEIPAGRAATPEEVAAEVIRLLEAGAYLTGQVITLDGGWC